MVKTLKSKGKDEEFLGTVVPSVVSIFNAALEQLQAPVESPALLLKRHKEKYDARTLSEFVNGFVTKDHVEAAGVKRKVLRDRLTASMARYALYVPFTSFAVRFLFLVLESHGLARS